MGGETVIGLSVLREALEGFEGSYAIIGGTACDLLLSNVGLPFRATHDIDMVMIADTRLPDLASAIWGIVRDGGYEIRQRGNGEPCFYRFANPRTAGYPRMLELFSKAPDFIDGHTKTNLAPLHVGDDISSLSAILLDDDYYRFMRDGLENVDGLTVLDELHLIPFKAKAYLDLSKRRSMGERVDSHDIKKHKRDVLRLAQLIDPDHKLELPEVIRSDMENFLQQAKAEPVNTRQIGLGNISYGEVLLAISNAYGM